MGNRVLRSLSVRTRRQVIKEKGNTVKSSLKEEACQSASPKSTNSGNPFTDLSPELKLKILDSCSDVRSLKVLSQSSSSWFQVYLSNRDRLLSHVLIREIGISTAFDALAALRAPHIDDDRNGAPRVKKFLAQYRSDLAPAAVLDEKRILAEALPLAQLHLLVQEIVVDFYDSALSTRPQLNATKPSSSVSTPASSGSKSEPELTSVEIRRLYRSFYRYETLTRLFGEPRTPKPQDISTVDPCYSDTPWDEITLRDRSDMFLALFPPWEVEGIATVFDYLIRRYEAAFRAVAKPSSYYESYHKSWVPWYKRRWATESRESTTDISIECTFFPDYPEISSYYGLRFLSQLKHTPAASNQHQLLQSHSRCPRFPTIKSIFHARPASTIYPGPNGRQVNEYLEIEGTFEFEGDFSGDEDAGGGGSRKEYANAAWVWAHDGKNYQCYWQRCFSGLRKWGYVFWDHERLDRWGVLGAEVDRVRELSEREG